MARRTFDVIDVVEILQHWYAGRSKTDVAASVGVDRGTVRKYVAAAEAAGLSPGGPVLGRAEWIELVRGWFPELVDAQARSLTYPEINAHRERIQVMLGTNTVSTVHQRLRDEHGLRAGISSFRRYVWLEFPELPSAERVTVWRPEVAPGDEAQIDYGYLGSWFDPIASRARRVWAFVMVLAASRHMFVRPVFRMDQQAWVAAHVAAFEFFDGVPSRLVPDNLRTGVMKPDLYDPKLNRAYAELAAHYDTLIDPARAAKPKDKPRVERPMPYIRDSFWRGRDWDSLDAMQTAALGWCLEVAGRRRHRSLEGAQPYAVFAAVEGPALRALPVETFELATWSRPKVGTDCHVKVAGALYSVPWSLIGQTVDARASDRTVEIFVDGTLHKTHRRVERGRATDWADYPPEKIAFFMRTPVWCRRRARELGANVAEIITELLAVNALHRLRSAQGIIGLAERHGAVRLDAACRHAIDVGDPTYRTVKGILVAGTETGEPVESSTAIVPAHLHGPTRLFAITDAEVAS
jgi:transposase